MKQTIQIKEPILDELTKRGNNIRVKLDKDNVFSLNVMASPGAGKTSVIMKTIECLSDRYEIAVIEGDVVPIDVEKIQKLKIPVVLAQTGGACHMDSIMMEQAVKKLNINSVDLLIVENVGNLICPASFYLGTHKNVVIASVPEGDDKPYKYPTMFRGADIVLVNKSDYLQHESFSMKNFRNGVKDVNSDTEIIQISCKTNEGLGDWVKWVENELKRRKNEADNSTRTYTVI